METSTAPLDVFESIDTTVLGPLQDFFRAYTPEPRLIVDTAVSRGIPVFTQGTNRITKPSKLKRCLLGFSLEVYFKIGLEAFMAQSACPLEEHALSDGPVWAGDGYYLEVTPWKNVVINELNNSFHKGRTITELDDILIVYGSVPLVFEMKLGSDSCRWFPKQKIVQDLYPSPGIYCRAGTDKFRYPWGENKRYIQVAERDVVTKIASLFYRYETSWT